MLSAACERDNYDERASTDLHDPRGDHASHYIAIAIPYSPEAKASRYGQAVAG
jgi:hypothetical protein